MKKMMTFLKKAKVKAFTLVEKRQSMTKEKQLLLRWWKARQNFIAWKRMKMLA